MTKVSNWKASKRPQEKSEQTPKFHKRRAKALKQMMQKLKREDSNLPLIFVLN
jgi:hypothetical protein